MPARLRLCRLSTPLATVFVNNPSPYVSTRSQGPVQVQRGLNPEPNLKIQFLSQALFANACRLVGLEQIELGGTNGLPIQMTS
jgi:hypothetical protein